MGLIVYNWTSGRLWDFAKKGIKNDHVKTLKTQENGYCKFSIMVS